MSIYRMEKGKLLTAIMLFAVVSAGVFVLVSEDCADAADEDIKQLPTAVDNIITIKENGKYVLNDNVNCSIVIEKEVTVVLDLNGNTITNTDKKHTITNNGTLTIVDSVGGGTVDNTTPGKGPVYNYGDMTIEGGSFIRSAEIVAEKSPDEGKGWDNTHYVIVNAGTMTINGGEFYPAAKDKQNLGNVSSVIRNGIHDKKADGSYNSYPGELKITGGIFIGAANILKNEPKGTITSITGGTFTMDNTRNSWIGGNNLFQNYGEIVEIKGGSFKALGSGNLVDPADINAGNYSRYGLYNAGTIGEIGGSVTFEMSGNNNRLLYNNGGDSNSMNITGGSFSCKDTIDGGNNESFLIYESPTNKAPFIITGGDFNGDVGKRSSTSIIEIKGGSFDTDVSEYIAPGYEDNVAIPTTPTIPDDDDELPFIPPQSGDDNGADTTTYVAVAAAAAVVAILAVLAVGISKGKL